MQSKLKPVVLFLVGTGLALMINLPRLKSSSKTYWGKRWGCCTSSTTSIRCRSIHGIIPRNWNGTALTNSIVQNSSLNN